MLTYLFDLPHIKVQPMTVTHQWIKIFKAVQLACGTSYVFSTWKFKRNVEKWKLTKPVQGQAIVYCLGKSEAIQVYWGLSKNV